MNTRYGTKHIWGLAVGLLLSHGSYAAAVIEKTSVLPGELPDATWIQDRAAPDGIELVDGFEGRDGVLEITIDGNAVNEGSAFHRTEGVKRPTPASNAVEVDLFLSSEWQEVPVRAGIWAQGQGSGGAGFGSWGIIEFVTGSEYGPAANASVSTGFRFWDSRAPGAWLMTNTNLELLWDTWVNLRVELNFDDRGYDYFINGAPVGSFPWGEDEDVTQIGEVIFNHYDYNSIADEATTLHADYTIAAYSAHWSNLVLDTSHASIQAAVDAADEGDTISVSAGTYNHFSVPENKDGLSIIGAEGAQITRTEGGSAIGRVVDIYGDDVTLSGFTISGENDVGVSISGYGVIVEHNTIDGVLTGIQTTTHLNGGGNTIRDNTITNATVGISLQNSGNTVTDNESSAGIGIGNYQGSIGEFGILGNVVTGNTFTRSAEIWRTGTPQLTPEEGTMLIGRLMSGNSSVGGYITNILNSEVAPSVETIGGNVINNYRLFGTIQQAVDAAPENAIIRIVGGAYQENITVPKSGLNFVGLLQPALTGQFNITGDNVTVSGFDITNPSGTYAILVNGGDNADISDNTIHAVGTSATSHAQGIYLLGAITGATVNDNTVSNVGNPAASGATNKGIYVGDSNSAAASGITITNNVITGIHAKDDAVFASGGRGAYGVLVNHETTGLQVSHNQISDLQGFWVHAIGLEANTPSASVTNNVISGLTATKLTVATVETMNADQSAAGIRDEVAVFFESNPGSATTVITENTMTADIAFGVMLFSSPSATATHNYWGAAAGPTTASVTAGAGVHHNVTHSPWYVSTTFNATQLSNYVAPPVEEPPVEEPPPPVDTTPPPPPPPPPPTQEEEVSNIVDDIEIPDADSGETISEQAVAVLEDAASASTELAASVIENIETVTTTSAIGALDVIKEVLTVSGNAATNTVATSNTQAAASVTASANASLTSFSSVLTAISTKTTTTAVDLTPVQKTAVQAATVTAAAAAVKVITAAPTPEARKEVLTTLSSIITANVNLGVNLTAAQGNTLKDAAQQATDPNASPDQQLETSVTIKPVNKEVISKVALTEALAGSGITESQVDAFLAELADAINPANVVVGDTNGNDALSDGTGGTVDTDTETGITTFTVGGAEDAQTLIDGRRISAVTQPLVIPTRVISSSVVASSFPEGVKVLANGSVAITASQIASVVVPASYDPINFYADLSAKGAVSVDGMGNVLLTGNGYTFSATFDFTGTGSAEPVAVTTVTPPSSGNEADLSYVFTVTYRDGTTQILQPYLEADAFVASAQSRGLDVKILRNTGIILVSGRQFRPSYFVDARNADQTAFYNIKKDASGIAYRPIDANGDGTLDYEVITASGVQVAYGL